MESITENHVHPPRYRDEACVQEYPGLSHSSFTTASSHIRSRSEAAAELNRVGDLSDDSPVYALLSDLQCVFFLDPVTLPKPQLRFSSLRKLGKVNFPSRECPRRVALILRVSSDPRLDIFRDTRSGGRTVHLARK